MPDLPKLNSEQPMAEQPVLHLLFAGRNMLASADGSQFLFQLSELNALGLSPGEKQYAVGDYNESLCLVSQLDAEVTPPDHYRWCSLYSLLGVLSDSDFNWVGRGTQLLSCYRDHRFCGRCGHENRQQEQVHGCVCDHCGFETYPRISPAVIMLVTRGDECLLAKNVQWVGTDRFSALAGFVEPGEYAETTVRREVMEEVGLRVSSIEYLGSQPWPFPGQLMLGFLAEYESGDIQPDPAEIAEAHWYRYDALPPHPDQRALSGRVIQAFVERCQQRNR